MTHLTRKQSRAVDEIALREFAMPTLLMMENAARSAAVLCGRLLRDRPGEVVVLAGPGNNGGDGLALARFLHNAGREVTVGLVVPGAEFAGDAAVNFGIARAMGVPVEAASAELLARPAALVVDAMFGTGLTRDIAPGVWGSLAMAQARRCRIVAVDILSGLCADSGRVRSADYIETPVGLTVTFQRPRVGHHLGQGAALSGRLRVVDIGLERQVQDLLQEGCEKVVDLDWVRTSALPKVVGHKFGYGHALILSGGVGRGGAARLAARGALRIGAGLVTVGCPPAAVIENAARLEAVMLRPVPDAAALAAVLEDGRINAVCLGPGMGVARAGGMLPVVLGTPRRVVLDADALTALAENRALFAHLHRDCVLTPHAGEFARLFPDIAARLAAAATKGPAHSKVDATRDAAAQAGCVVLFKGADTVIADPSGACSINSAAYDRAAPWLATAGSGDVLAGFITGLLARGLPPLQAAETAAWLHVACARSFGPGLIAEDLPEELPKVFRGLAL